MAFECIWTFQHAAGDPGGEIDLAECDRRVVAVSKNRDGFRPQ